MIRKTRLNFAFIGAGSTSFTLNLLSDILHEDFIVSGEFRLVDIDPQALEAAYEAARAFVKSAGRDFKVTRHTDFREAIPGIDFVFFTFVTGRFPSWKQDVDICTRHGVLQSVGDTIGPGGIIRAIRNIPVVVEVAREMEAVSPEAWAINYSNPEGALCLAIEKYTKIKTFGLCHGTPDTVAALAEEVYRVPREKLKYRAAGVNHLTWITQLEIDGEDVYPRLRGLLGETGFDRREPISAQLFDVFGLYPAPGDRHVGEFFPFYLKERVLAEQNYTWKNVDISLMASWREDRLKTVSRLISGEIGYDGIDKSGETSTHFMRALITGEKTLEMANVINRGYIENISDGVIVEIPCFVDSFGLHPQKIGRLPAGAAAKCESLGREYNLIADAAVNCDRAPALQAIMLDPLAANCDYPERLLDELIRSYLGVLPAKWAEIYH
ncbi:MAG: alpha-glucosidase/alpha-galactosidase [Firmicutes bacterium]|nr:alpha-glucosidase/alpha-galactosidase [Bacillota bacterium]